MTDKTIPVTQTTNLDREDVESALITFIDQSIPSWSWWGGIDAVLPMATEAERQATRSERFARHVMLGGAIVLDTVSDEGEPEEVNGASVHHLTLELFLEGLVKAATESGVSVKQFLDDHDAATIDTAVQWACFQEVVYA